MRGTVEEFESDLIEWLQRWEIGDNCLFIHPIEHTEGDPVLAVRPGPVLRYHIDNETLEGDAFSAFHEQFNLVMGVREEFITFYDFDEA